MEISTEIRHLVKARLIAANIVGDRVKACQLRPLNHKVFPAIWVYDSLQIADKSDTSDQIGDGDQGIGAQSVHLFPIVAVGVDAGTADEETVEDDLDDLCAEVRRTMEGTRSTDTDWGLQTQVLPNDGSQRIWALTYIKTEKKDFPGGDRVVLTALIYYDIQYRGQA